MAKRKTACRSREQQAVWEMYGYTIRIVHDQLFAACHQNP